MKNDTSDHKYSLEYVLARTGSSIPLDCLYLYLNTSVSVIGVIFNIICLLVLTLGAEFKNVTLYKYLRVYTANSLLICLASILDFAANSPHFIDWKFYKWSQLYYVYCYVIIVLTANLFGSCLDIVISLDRIADLTPRFKVRFLSSNIYLTCLCCLVFTVALTAASYLQYEPRAVMATLENNDTLSVWYPAGSDMLKRPAYKIYVYVLYFARDFIIMIILLVLNVTSLIALRAHLKKKAKLMSQNKESLKKLVSSEKRTSIMVSLLCLFSMTEHILVFTMSVYPILNSENILSVQFHYLYFFGPFSITLKHSLNFVILVSFNVNFRRHLLQVFKRSPVSVHLQSHV